MLKKGSHIHFAGIGGIGMSALAGILKHRNFIISGSDNNLEQKSIQKLSQLGCIISHQNTTCLSDLKPDLLVYSTAISSTSTIMQDAQKLNIPIIHRADLLAELTRGQKSIAITGAHGKTTTSSMISHLFISANQEPTVILGGFLESIDSNYLAGSGEWLIAEADESDRSMLKLHPRIIIITNIDNEHLDTYEDAKDMQQAFYEFLQKLPPNGHAIVFLDNPETKELVLEAAPETRKKIITYGRSPEADFVISQEIFGKEGSRAQIKKANNETISFSIAQSGPHMIENATAAIISGQLCNITTQQIITALETFTGVEQRFTYRGLYRNSCIIDDYAHHPTEIAHALETAQRHEPTKLIVVFQPQRYSRTEALWSEFIDVFAHAQIDCLLITDIYSASETQKNPSINAKNLADAINKTKKINCAAYIPQDDQYRHIRETIEKEVQPGSLVLFLGAGKVNKLSTILVKTK